MKNNAPISDICSLDNVRQDWRILDDDTFSEVKGVRLISHELFTSVPEISVEFIPPGKFAAIFARIPFVYWFIYATKLFVSADVKTVIIINGGIVLLWFWCGILNAVPFVAKRRLFCWDVFVEYILGKEKRLWYLPFFKLTTKRKEKIARFVLSQYGLNVVWSNKQVFTHAKHFNLPDHHFIFLPFKANHSIKEMINIHMDNFVFAGGNGKRDYQCLIEAVRGTDIPVIISATDPQVRKRIELLDNVVVLGASEPAFGQLQAAARFVVIPMVYSGLKGGGEANFCNAMWHGKPIVAVDSMSAEDYIVDGKTGYIIQSGDSIALREKILLLWGNPVLCHEMGSQGRAHVEKLFTHYKFIRRLLRLALLYGYQ